MSDTDNTIESAEDAEMTAIAEGTTEPTVVTTIDGEPAVEAAANTEKPVKAPRVKREPLLPHPCLCSVFGYGDLGDISFDMGCESTTLRTFAQGHDAQLVSALVNAHFDGYSIFRRDGEARVVFDDPGHALSTVSPALANKADSATKNARLKIEAKENRKTEREAARAAKRAEKEAAAAEKAAAKAAEAETKKAATPAPRDVPVTVAKAPRADAHVAVPQEDGTKLVLIKVGRLTADAVLSADGTTVTYLDKDGAEQVRETDTVRMLSQVEA